MRASKRGVAQSIQSPSRTFLSGTRTKAGIDGLNRRFGGYCHDMSPSLAFLYECQSAPQWGDVAHRAYSYSSIESSRDSSVYPLHKTLTGGAAF